MAKEGNKAGQDDPKETEKATAKVEEGVERRVENAPDPSKAVNIIGDLKKPDPTDKDEVKAYFKKIDEKLDQLLGNNKKPEEKPPELKEPETMPKKEEKRIPWYERNLI